MAAKSCFAKAQDIFIVGWLGRVWVELDMRPPFRGEF